jgi:hypothetical protein
VVDFKLLEQTLEAIVVPRPEPTAAQSQHLCLDKGYDYDGPRQLAYDFGLITHIRRRGEDRSATPAHPHTPHRWVVERVHSWLNRYRRILDTAVFSSVGKSSPLPMRPGSRSSAPSRFGSSSAYWNRF